MRRDSVRWGVVATVIVGLLSVLATITVPFIESALRDGNETVASEPGATVSQPPKETPVGEAAHQTATQPEKPKLTDAERLATSQAEFERCVAEGPDRIRRELQTLRVGVLYCWTWREFPTFGEKSRWPAAHLVRAIRVKEGGFADVITDRLCSLTMDSDQFTPGVSRTGEAFDEGATAAIVGCRSYRESARNDGGENGGETFDVLISDGERNWRFELGCFCQGFHALRIDNATFAASSRKLTLAGTITASEISAGGRKFAIEGAGDRKQFRLAVTFAPDGSASAINLL